LVWVNWWGNASRAGEVVGTQVAGGESVLVVDGVLAFLQPTDVYNTLIAVMTCPDFLRST